MKDDKQYNTFVIPNLEGPLLGKAHHRDTKNIGDKLCSASYQKYQP